MKKPEYIRVKIERFDPDADKKKRFQVYSVPRVSVGLQTAMNILEYIYDELDPSLAFYRSCRGGVCGGCRILVNGKPGLSCMKIIKEDVIFKPIPGYEIVRDLVVDFNKRTSKLTMVPKGSQSKPEGRKRR